MALSLSLSRNVQLKKYSFPHRLWRDIKLITNMGIIFIGWLIIGNKVRRDYRRCQEEGKPYFVDSHRK